MGVTPILVPTDRSEGNTRQQAYRPAVPVHGKLSLCRVPHATTRTSWALWYRLLSRPHHWLWSTVLSKVVQSWLSLVYNSHEYEMGSHTQALCGGPALREHRGPSAEYHGLCQLWTDLSINCRTCSAAYSCAEALLGACSVPHVLMQDHPMIALHNDSQ
jgi:hypothetical protein